MDNPYLEKVRRSIDERLGRPIDELQVVALLAIATELQAIRRNLEGAPVQPAREPAPEPAARTLVFDELSDGIVVG